MTDSVETIRDGAVTVVTLHRAAVRNAVDADTARQLHAAFLAFDADPQARVAVFHGAHGHFCAGWDLQAGARLAQESHQGWIRLLRWSLLRRTPHPWGPWARHGFICPNR